MVEGVDGEWEEEDEVVEDTLEEGEEDEMAKMMGFGGFGTSKVSLVYYRASLLRRKMGKGGRTKTMARHNKAD